MVEGRVVTPAALWTGRILSGLVGVAMLLDSVSKFMKPPQVTASFTQLGLSWGLIMPVGLLCLVCTLLYLVPRTAVLGAVLLTGYLGAAVVLNLRIGEPMFSHVLFPVYVGAVAWAGLWLRDTRVRAAF